MDNGQIQDIPPVNESGNVTFTTCAKAWLKIRFVIFVIHMLEAQLQLSSSVECAQKEGPTG